MTSLAIFGCAVVQANRSAINFFLLRVTLRATYHAVRAVKRIIGLTVVEGAGAPF